MTVKTDTWLVEECMPLPWCGCWIWMGNTTHDGYGRLSVDGVKGVPAHRYAYELFVGPILPGYVVAHKHSCASKGCVNPEHLMQLTTKEHRMYDRNAKHSTEPAPETFKLQVHIPWDLYQQMLAITSHGGEHNYGRVYGGLSKIVILALRHYLTQAQTTTPMNLEDI